MDNLRALPTLNPHNFPAWKIAARAALTERGYLRAILPEEQTPTKDEYDLYLAELKAWRQLKFQGLERATQSTLSGASKRSNRSHLEQLELQARRLERRPDLPPVMLPPPHGQLHQHPQQLRSLMCSQVQLS